jgi:8-oxo-dGTP diphosphatase
MTCGFLTRDGAMLLMHRVPTTEIAPGLWAGLGGHLEPEELREVEEE